MRRCGARPRERMTTEVPAAGTPTTVGKKAGARDAAHWVSTWHRDLFPLPVLPETGCTGSGRHVRRQVRRELNRSVRALNWRAVGHSVEGPGPPTPLQEEVLARVEDLVVSAAPPSDAPSEEAALRELLRGHSVYEPVSAVNVVPYRPGELSLPGCLRQAPLITEVCSDRARKYLEGEGERMLRSGPDVQQLLEEVVAATFLSIPAWRGRPAFTHN